MKLIYCSHCCDVVALRTLLRHCDCKASWGKYDPDGLHAAIGGKAVPIGFSNRSLVAALISQPDAGRGSNFEAFVIPKECGTVRRDGE